MTSSLGERTRPAAPDPAAGAMQQRPSMAGRMIALVTAVVLAACGIVVWFTPMLGVTTVEVEAAGSTETSAAVSSGGAMSSGAATSVSGAASSGGAESSAVSNDVDPLSETVAAAVRAAVAVPDGTPLARIDLDEVRGRVLAVDSVSSATVRRQWPHTLVVTVAERIAVATTQANGRWWLLDSTGTPFSELATRPDGLMPVQLATPGEGDRATLAALGVLASLSPDVRATVSGISAATAYDVTLFLTGGGSVIWGSDSDAAAKNAVIPAMVHTAGHLSAGQTLDVSDPTLVTMRAAHTDEQGAADAGGPAEGAGPR